MFKKITVIVVLSLIAIAAKTISGKGILLPTEATQEHYVTEIVAGDSDDGNPGTTDYCDVGTGECLHVPESCNDCRIDICSPGVGCFHAPLYDDGTVHGINDIRAASMGYEWYSGYPPDAVSGGEEEEVSKYYERVRWNRPSSRTFLVELLFCCTIFELVRRIVNMFERPS